MDAYYDSPLNKAHYFSRKADTLSKTGLFDEAEECHGKAASLLVEALKLTNNLLARESIELQYQCHLKKQEILRLKKQHREVVKEAARVQKEVMSQVLKVTKKTEGGSGNLEKAIYRTFDEADSLLEILVNRKEDDVDQSSESKRDIQGSKHPKTDGVVIEELRVVNCQLRSLITELMSSLSASERQVSVLKARIIELENEVTSLQAGSSMDLSEPISDKLKSSNSEDFLKRFCDIDTDLAPLAPLEPVDDNFY